MFARDVDVKHLYSMPEEGNPFNKSNRKMSHPFEDVEGNLLDMEVSNSR
jgi:hypothetical protein